MLLLTDWRLFLAVAWLAPVLYFINEAYRVRIGVQWQAIREHTAVGLCNGFYFGRTGSEYVGKRVEAIAACG